MTKLDVLTRKEAADMLGLSVQTLANWASRGGPNLPFYKLGGRVVYRHGDLVAFLDSSKMIHTGLKASN